nr:unnamed protein product [Digitaria exilis]
MSRVPCGAHQEDPGSQWARSRHRSIISGLWSARNRRLLPSHCTRRKKKKKTLRLILSVSAKAFRGNDGGRTWQRDLVDFGEDDLISGGQWHMVR